MKRIYGTNNPDKYTKNYKIKKVRTINAVYPHASFEAEVLINDNSYYFNLDVHPGIARAVISKESLADGAWSYDVPLDYEDIENPKHEFVYLNELSVYREMAGIWNSNPVWDSSWMWRKPEEWLPLKEKEAGPAEREG